MKHLLLILMTTILVGQHFNVKAQTEGLDKGVNDVLEALSKGTANFTDLKGTLDDLKAKAQAEFEKEEAAIEQEKARLDRIQAELDQDKDRESKMMYEEWVVRSAANTKLMKAREVLHERALNLAMEKVVFKDQLKQAEQKLLSTLANHLKEQLDYHNSRMELLKKQLDEVEKMKGATLKQTQDRP